MANNNILGTLLYEVGVQAKDHIEFYDFAGPYLQSLRSGHPVSEVNEAFLKLDGSSPDLVDALERLSQMLADDPDAVSSIIDSSPDLDEQVETILGENGIRLTDTAAIEAQDQIDPAGITNGHPIVELPAEQDHFGQVPGHSDPVLVSQAFAQRPIDLQSYHVAVGHQLPATGTAYCVMTPVPRAYLEHVEAATGVTPPELEWLRSVDEALADVDAQADQAEAAVLANRVAGALAGVFGQPGDRQASSARL